MNLPVFSSTVIILLVVTMSVKSDMSSMYYPGTSSTPGPSQNFTSGGYGPPSKPVQGVSNNSETKLPFWVAMAAYKVLILWLLYVLYQIVYVGSAIPQTAQSIPQDLTGSSNIKGRQSQNSQIDHMSLFVQDLLDGNFDINKLFA